MVVEVVRRGGSIDAVVSSDQENVLVSLDEGNRMHVALKERQAVANAIATTGVPLFLTTDPWARDTYVMLNRVVIPRREFEELGEGGMYVEGKGYVLISKAIEQRLLEAEKENRGIRNFFVGYEKVFVEPYAKPITIAHTKLVGSELKTKRIPVLSNIRHIDLTIGSIPSENKLFVDEFHFAQEPEVFEYLEEKYGVEIHVTSGQDQQPNRWFPNNFTVVQNGKTYVIAAKGAPVQKKGSDVRFPDVEIDRLPTSGYGGIRCMTNKGSLELWDALRIPYREFKPN